jgi:hypothetical protein
MRTYCTEPRCPSSFTPRSQPYNLLAKPHEANDNGHVKSLNVTPQLVGREFFLIGDIEIQAARCGIGYLLEVIHLLLSVNTRGSFPLNATTDLIEPPNQKP